MPNFLRSCQCQGYPPEGIAPKRRFSRPDLIALMLRDRSVARFAVAPAGYGRTALACEYADIVFGFKHVFWVSCARPCFLRDLDAGTLVEDLRSVDPDAALVVWDDVPRLAPERAEAFAAVIDALLESGIEVLVTCTPSADAFSALQRDRTLLTGADLMLSSAEMRNEEASGRLREGWETTCAPVDRTPCLRWADDGERQLVEGAACEEVPAEVRLAGFVLMALGQGAVDDVAAFLPDGRADEVCALLAEQYPFFGIDLRSGLFCAVEPSAEQLAASYRRVFEACAAASPYGSGDALCERLADVLVARGRSDRAAGLASAFMSKPDIARWLARIGYRMLLSGSPGPFVLLHGRVRRHAGDVADELSALRGWAWLELGDAVRSVAGARRAASSEAASPRARLVAALASLRGSNAAGRARMVALLRDCLDRASAGPLAANEAMSLSAEGMDWPCLAAMALQLEEGPSGALELWHERRNDEPEGVEAALARRNALLLAAAWALDELAAGAPEAPVLQGSLDELARYIRACVEHEASSGALGWCAATAAAALERIAASDARYGAFLPAAPALAVARRAEVGLFEQREQARRQLAGPAVREGEGAAMAGAPFAGDAGASGRFDAPERQASIPLLRVRLFGGLQVSIGDEPVARCELSRHKTRLLLALLVTNCGHEVSRHRLAEMLWPSSRPKSAMKNFYSVWSQLRRALTVDGGCPYLLRTQEGCRLNPHLTVTDVAGFNALLRSLTLPHDDDDWQRMYDLVCNDYVEDLLPCDRDNETINALRHRYHAMLVDALLAAAEQLLSAGKDRGALWFAREAVRRDPRREDACILLMGVQRQLNQRPEALETYFSCRRHLSEELGIDPSERLVRLYRSIIESEQPLD